jgi:hypothetical protein
VGSKTDPLPNNLVASPLGFAPAFGREVAPFGKTSFVKAEGVPFRNDKDRSYETTKTRTSCKSSPWSAKSIAGLLRWGDADGVGAAGTEVGAAGGLQGFGHADFDGGEVVVAAAEGEAVGREGGVALCEEFEDVGGRHGDLVVEAGELCGDGDGVDGLAGEVEEGVGCEAGAGAVGLPLVAEEAGVGVDVAVLAGVLRAGGVGTVFDVGAGVVLGPEAVKDEGEVLGALGCGLVGVAELGRPGEVEEVVVEVLWPGGGGDRAGLWGVALGLGCGAWWLPVCVRPAQEVHEDDDEDEEEGVVMSLHGGLVGGRSSISGTYERD